MACGACGSSGRSRARSGPTRTLYTVLVRNGSTERVAYQSHNLESAQTVAGRYNRVEKGRARIDPDPDAPAEQASTEQTTDETAEPATSA
jgi:hypothetical protein